jgi:hypothetical protein
MAVPVVLPSLLGIQLDQRVDAHDGHTRLHRALELLDLAHTRLQHAHLQLVAHAPLEQVQAVVLVVLLARERLFIFGVVRRVNALGQGVPGAELGDQVAGVEGGVDCEGFGDNEEGLGEGGYGELLAGALSRGLVMDNGVEGFTTYNAGCPFFEVDV